MLGDEFMEAQTDEDEDEQADEKDGKAKTLEEEYDADRAFSNKSVWSRIAIIAAGPLFNFLLALILSIIILVWTVMIYVPSIKFMTIHRRRKRDLQRAIPF